METGEGEKYERGFCPAFTGVSPLAPLFFRSFFFPDQRRAQWAGVAGCSDWLQNEASVFLWEKNENLYWSERVGLCGGKALNRNCRGKLKKKHNNNKKNHASQAEPRFSICTKPVRLISVR